MVWAKSTSITEMSPAQMWTAKDPESKTPKQVNANAAAPSRCTVSRPRTIACFLSGGRRRGRRGGYRRAPAGTPGIRGVGTGENR